MFLLKIVTILYDIFTKNLFFIKKNEENMELFKKKNYKFICHI